MNRYSILGPAMATLGLAVMAAAGLAALQGNAGAEQKTLRQQLVGTWSFVRTEATQQDGTKLLPFGPSPRGVNIFTEDGHFSQIQVADGIASFASKSRVTGTAEENKAVVQGSLALFGTYTVDETAKTIVYKVEASTFPNWVGQEQTRPIDSLTAGELRHSNAGASIAGARTVNIWTRAK
jgi:Lipocalin-like domain